MAARPGSEPPAGARVHLRRPAARDRDELLALARTSRRLHRPWVEPPHTPAAYDAYLRRLRSDRHAGFLVCRCEDGAIAGVVNLNEIVRGAFQSAYLGYYGSAALTGRGYMSEGLRLVVRHAFTTLGLHRLEANVQPGNARSIALVSRCGFAREGFSPRYLKVAGRWRDHERFALRVESWRAAERAARGAGRAVD